MKGLKEHKMVKQGKNNISKDTLNVFERKKILNNEKLKVCNFVTKYFVYFKLN